MLLSSIQKEYIKKSKIKNIIIFFVQILLVSLFFISWEYCSNKNIINSFIFSSPSRIVSCIKTLYLNNNLFCHIYTTLYEIFISFIIGFLISFIIGIILYEFKILYKIIDPFLTILNSIPKVALGPIIIIWFGANNKSIIIMALLINVIVSILNIINGFNNIENVKIKMFKSLHATERQILFKLVIPNSFSNIISSLKINISMTLIGVIMGELLVSKEGLGYLIIYGTQIFDLNLVITSIILISITSFILYKLITLLERLIKS